MTNDFFFFWVKVACLPSVFDLSTNAQASEVFYLCDSDMGWNISYVGAIVVSPMVKVSYFNII